MQKKKKKKGNRAGQHTDMNASEICAEGLFVSFLAKKCEKVGKNYFYSQTPFWNLISKKKNTIITIKKKIK